MKRERMKIKNLVILALAFISILLLQSMIFMSFDDYGYGALNYAVGNQFNQNGGVGYSIIDIFKFLQATYMVWAGRVFYQFLLILCLRQGEWFIQIVQSIVIFLTIFFTTKAFSKTDNFIRNFIIILALFFCIPIAITKLSLYWYCASVIYFWPFMFFMAGLCLIKKMNNLQSNIFYTILLAFLGIASGWSQEQVGMAFCTYLFINICLSYFEKNNSNYKNKIIFFIANVVGYILLIIAPGNFVRMSDGSSGEILKRGIFETIFEGIKAVIFSFKYVNLSIIYIAIIVCIILLLTNKESNNKVVEQLKKISLYIIIVSELIVIIGNIIDSAHIKYIAAAINIIFMLLCLIIYIVLYKDKILACIVCSASASLIPILVSPYFVDRMIFPLFYMLIIGLFVLIENIRLISKLENYKKSVKIVENILILYGFLSYMITLNGYFENSIPKNINNWILRESSKQINTGEKMGTINLYKNINEKYTGTQPYEVDYTESIKSYFNINQDVSISIQNFPEKNPLNALKILYKDGIKGLKDLNNVYEIDAVYNKMDVASKLIGFYNLESYPKNSFYWIEKDAICKLINDKISQNGIKLKIDVNREKLLMTLDKSIESPKIKIIVNDVEVREEELLDGKQEINIQPHEINGMNDIYKIELKGNCDFSPQEIGEGEDSRRLYIKVLYIGNN